MSRSQAVDLKAEIWKKLTEQQHVFLATADAEQPRVRPVTLIRLLDKLFVATGAEDAKTEQVKKNPKVEFCLLLEEGEHKGSLRAECLAKVVEDRTLKTQVFSRVSFIKEFFPTPDAPGFALIELQPTALEYMRPGSVQAEKIVL